MAIIKVISKHGKTKAGIDYILNPAKTQGLIFSSTMNCDISGDTSFTAKQFDIVQRFRHFNEKKPRQGRYLEGNAKQNVTSLHIIQSFKGQEVSAEQAHKIAQEMVRNTYGPHAQVVIATHTDRENIHNHIIINSVDMAGRKLYNNKEARAELRLSSDELCKKYGLSVIENPYEQSFGGIHYKEWSERQKNTSWKEEIRLDIDKSILSCGSWEKFKEDFEAKGYKINERGKYASIQRYKIDKYGVSEPIFKPFRFKTLGYHYTEERIKQRITDPGKHNIRLAGKKEINAREYLHEEGLFFAMQNNDLALKLLKALEVLFRLIIQNRMRRTRKSILSEPYSLMNDYYIARLISQLIFIKKHNIKSKKELDLALIEPDKRRKNEKFIQKEQRNIYK